MAKTVCPRCKADVLDDLELAAGLERALLDIDRAKQRWPLGVAATLREISRVMRCRLGACEER